MLLAHRGKNPVSKAFPIQFYPEKRSALGAQVFHSTKTFINYLIFKEVPMIPNKLIEAVVIFVFLAAAAGQLPRLIKTVQIAQYKLLKDSQASKWPKAMLLPIRK